MVRFIGEIFIAIINVCTLALAGKRQIAEPANVRGQAGTFVGLHSPNRIAAERASNPMMRVIACIGHPILNGMTDRRTLGTRHLAYLAQIGVIIGASEFVEAFPIGPIAGRAIVPMLFGIISVCVDIHVMLYGQIEPGFQAAVSAHSHVGAQGAVGGVEV